MKKGGTSRGNTAITPTKKIVTNLKLRKRSLWRLSVGVISYKGWIGVANHSMKVVDRIGHRSLISPAAGRPVANVMRPMILKVQAGPTRWMMPFIERLITIPPRPPPAQTIPLARPRFL